MSFFLPHASKRANWLLIAIGISLAAIISTSAIAAVKHIVEKSNPLLITLLSIKSLSINLNAVCNY